MISIRSTISLILSIAFGCTALSASSTEKFDKELRDEYFQEIDNFPSIITADNVNTQLNKIPGYKGKPSTISVPLEDVILTVYVLRTVPVEFNRIIDHLLAVGANPNDCRYSVNLITLVKQTENYDLIKKLIDHGGKVDPEVLYWHPIFYWKPIYFLDDDYRDLVIPKNCDLVNLLVEHGAIIAAKDLKHNYVKYPNIMKHLLNQGINVTVSKEALNDKNILQAITASANPAKKSILRVFDALQTSTPTDPDAQDLVRAYHMFQQGNHEPLRQMLITQPWVLCQLTRNKQMPKDEEWTAQGKPIPCNAFAVERMTVACQQALKPECIKPLIRFLALETIDPTTMEETDGRTMCERKQMMDMYNVALDASPKAIAPVATSSKIKELEDKK